MAELIELAYLPSESLIKRLKKKFPAFTSADLTERAEKEGAYKSDRYGTGWYFTSTSKAGSSSGVLYVDVNGDLNWCPSNGNRAGVRVALQVIYNPNNSPANSCRSEKRTAKIWNEEKRCNKEVTSEAPIVTFGKKEYIWLNEEECKNGTAKTMELISIKLLAKAEPFDKYGKHNDYGKADEIRKQCEELVLEGCTEEEKAMIVRVRLSDKDGYQSATPAEQPSPELLYACVDGELEKVKELLKSNQIDINAQCEEYGNTPLTAAVYFGYMDIIQVLMADPRIDINARGPEGSTPLMIATQKENIEVIKQLLKSDEIDLHAKDEEGDTILFYLNKAKHKEEIMNLLAEKEAQTKAQTSVAKATGKTEK